MDDVEVVLAALYLRGGPACARVARRGWRGVRSLLLREGSTVEMAEETLRRGGYRDEAAALSSAGRVAWAEAQWAAGSVLTAISEGYPRRWERVLGDGAPPALWKCGPLPIGPHLALVGSREVAPATYRLARDIARLAVSTGFVVVSGGAMGVDRAAKVGAGEGAIEILARGVAREIGTLSLAPPGETFTGALAMERNALIYAAADVSVVVHARLREGGSWHGAVDALRRRLSVILVGPCPGRSTLLALGAHAVDSPAQAVQLAQSPPLSRNLWSPLEEICTSGGPAVASAARSEA